MQTGSTAVKVRKRDTGEQGNRGEFAAVRRSEAHVEVSDEAPPETVDLPESVVKVCHFYDLSGLQATRQGDGTVRIDAQGRVITDDFEEAGIDPDVLCQQINRHYPDADAHVEDIGHDLQPWDDVVYSLSVTSESEDAASIDQAIFDHPLVNPCDDTAEQGIWEGAKTETAIRQAKTAVDAYAERTRAPRQTAAQARARAAYVIYRDAAQEETQEAIDGLRALGARRGAAYVSFPPDDDIDDSALLSGHPVFWDADGEAMDWSEDPSVQNGDEYAAWMFSDRDDAIVSDLAPNVREDRDLDAMSDRTDHAFTYRCTEKGS
ncbi:hypothetical protein BH708_02540 [Brachybacterium sp. P6-10-X1]|uniref:hypothetical protein n=1 Tax=Brachybacterium sp. P6-10-X1 TaxID=1903186 RepID=UPI00097175F2|nr:hypothetical protein [Brachybacterium sp. P6-10-X1]APX31780.1 hypothetical protein BH708_02540 [Brachybacterium sp. P6-10-X1]